MWMLKASLVAVTDVSSGIMRLQPATAWPDDADAVALGPLSTRTDAHELCEILTDLFDLCRYWQILVKAPHGTPCAYFEMGRSGAPCAGQIPMEQYNETVRQAIAFAGPDREKILRGKNAAMLEAAGDLQFERAGDIKFWLARAAALDEPRFRDLTDVRQFAGLAISKFRTRARPFFFWAGAIETDEPVKLSKIDEHLSAWRERLDAGPQSQTDNLTRQWQCGLMTTHLSRPERKDLAWLPASGDMASSDTGGGILAFAAGF